MVGWFHSFIFLPIKVTGLYRYAVKGLSGDTLSRVEFSSAGETFPDDRRYALLQADATFQGEWLHKENFLCAFTAPELMASLESSYRIVEPTNETPPQRLITIKQRDSGTILLHNSDLATQHGRTRLATLLSQKSGRPVTCVTSDSATHDHQFGNTSSGVKKRGDTRTLHIINANTVREVSKKTGIPLDPRRFRPNVIIDGPPAWSEFDWVEQNACLVSSDGLKLAVISKTVRCRGVSVDPLDPSHVVDIPALLVQHFPEYGPYLGIYAVVDAAGSIQLDNTLTLN